MLSPHPRVRALVNLQKSVLFIKLLLLLLAYESILQALIKEGSQKPGREGRRGLGSTGTSSPAGALPVFPCSFSVSSGRTHMHTHAHMCTHKYTHARAHTCHKHAHHVCVHAHQPTGILPNCPSYPWLNLLRLPEQ
ncbi:unnamed protein product [Rangifer tarandus platyrhynchus]|uniref:Uncharacterized protein n=1 Tax=Rangifer tarandus platyrhynchus TaxID=3082113 RepID=A0ABN8YWR4_RANTA|nr:unnamed protein product [Rangifer tarandus platyrhynchus]